jgi:hypothetical protein
MASSRAQATYHESLTHDQGHNLDPEALVEQLESHGARLLCQGPSVWRVSRAELPYLWDCLAHFFGLGLLPRLGPRGWDVPAWRRRLLEHGPDMHVRRTLSDGVPCLACLVRGPQPCPRPPP